MEGDLEGVETALAAAVSADPEDLDAYVGLARVYRSRGQLGRAISLSQTLVLRHDLDPVSRNRARVELAASFREGGFSARAIEVYEEVLAEDRHHVEALQALSGLLADEGQFMRALSYLRRRARLDGEPARREEARLLWKLSEQADAEGRREASRRALRKALRRDPEYAPAHLCLARRELARGRARSAARSFLRVAALDSDLAPEAYAGLQESRSGLRRRGAYEALLRGRRQEEPSDAGAALALARHLLLEGRPTEAKREMRALLEHDPEQAAAIVLLGRIMLTLAAESDGDSAAKAYAELLEELDLRLATARHGLGEPS